LYWSQADKDATKVAELIFKPVYADSSNQNKSEQFVLCIHPSVVNFDPHPTPQSKV
jgi:hypothetical protein